MNLAFFKKFDRILVVSVLILISIGLIIILSTSYSSTGTDLTNFNKQIIFSIVGIAMMFVVSFFNYRTLKNYTGIFYIISCFVLFFLLFSGSSIRGTSSWFDLGFFNFQPAETVKIVIVIIMAKYLSKNTYVNDLKKILVSGVYIFFPVALILMQPDFGSAMVIVFVWFSMLFVSGMRKKSIVIIIMFGLVIASTSWVYVLKDYQKDRIITFVNPQSDSRGAGYNVNQSIIAIGSGEIWGKGLGHGSQSQLNFLPEKHTDFIFAVVAEEMGFIGVMLVLLVFGVIFYRFFKIIDETEDNFGKFLVIGAALLLMFHVVVNIGMNIGIMPVTGIPLPFISYGGSSLVSFMIIIGIVQGVYIKGRGYKIEKEE
ncbi:rod shape-determining protein RodA [Candidatus Parcubacteria bacterium]|nr:rod shape-determining protein RodA [Candidatus Parcubacteria bacterium]